ncbi:hypothetical protein GpartN1_g5068.t1 [Galdieria partita]|uniref:Amine oxidase n=1 Tax=Galdieria partita TaxID=83374 RepID=A0A9C7Q0I7_9RHOD|nr:hypothetical protein GpartN1_g5068.t1 [Galdieria partita]
MNGFLEKDIPFLPLQDKEVQLAASLCKAQNEYNGKVCRIIGIDLKEPSKEEYFKWRNSNSPLDRKAEVVVYNTSSTFTSVYVVSLKSKKVLSKSEFHNVQPSITLDEAVEAENLIKRDPKCQKILREEYNITDTDLITCDPWTVGRKDPNNRRLIQMFTWCRMNKDDENQYSHPVEGFLPIVDLNTMTIVQLQSYASAPVPKKLYPFRADKWTLRQDLKPFDVIQSSGPSFQVHGNHVKWQNWSFYVGFNSREGLVLHDIRYTEGTEERSILYRASVSEMVVPYGDPDPPHNTKRAFDEGEYGLGNCANSLRLGCDCLGHIHYFDACLTNTKGEPQIVRNAVCMHEEDIGLLWKHLELRTRHPESRRSRRLVISMIATLVNYDYGFFWYLYQDGKIEMKVKHTGQLNICGRNIYHNGMRNGSLVAPGLNAQYHQHFYSARLDFDIDGTENRVTEIDVVHPTDEELGVKTTQKNAITIRETVLCDELKATRDIDAAAARTWLVSSSRRRNYLGQPTGYKIVPVTVDKFLLNEDSAVVKRANFLKHALWVTSFDEDERYAAGQFPNQCEIDQGLGRWTQQNRSVLDRDIVVWYTFGITHVPQTEDWPVMPVVEAGFMLHPCNFFDMNPAMDVPPKSSSCSHVSAKI